MFTPRQRFWKRYFYRRLNKAFNHSCYLGSKGPYSDYFVFDPDARVLFRACLRRLVSMANRTWLQEFDEFLGSFPFDDVLYFLIDMLKRVEIGEKFWFLLIE